MEPPPQGASVSCVRLPSPPRRCITRCTFLPLRAAMLLGRWPARRSAFTAGRYLAACPRTAPRKVRGVVGSLGGGTGGCGRDGAFRIPAAVFVRPPPSLTWCLCVVWLGVVPQTSCPICCFCRVYIYIFALIVRRLAAASPDSLAAWRWWSGALAAACVAGLCGWRAPRGAGECGLLGNCGWIGCFSQPQ